MTLLEINTMVASFGLPYAYHHFTEKTAQEPPFIVFFYPSINDLYADGINYQRISELDIELYTSNKDFAKEEMIESALTNAGFSFAGTSSLFLALRLYAFIRRTFAGELGLYLRLFSARSSRGLQG